MDFLDSLENSLKSLESQEERDPSTLRRQENLRAQSLAAAPWAEKLKNAPYTHQLFDQAAKAGHRMRSKVYMAWLESTLRLEARGRWCELRPTPSGIVAEYVSQDGTIVSREASLETNPEELLTDWLGSDLPAA